MVVTHKDLKGKDGTRRCSITNEGEGLEQTKLPREMLSERKKRGGGKIARSYQRGAKRLRQ